MISLDKKYQTRDGREVRIYALDGAGAFPIQGAIKDKAGWAVFVWRADGRGFYPSFPTAPAHPADLIEVKPEHTGWLNVYRNCVGNVHSTKKDADTAIGNEKRVACIQITYREGDGL